MAEKPVPVPPVSAPADEITVSEFVAEMKLHPAVAAHFVKASGLTDNAKGTAKKFGDLLDAHLKARI